LEWLGDALGKAKKLREENNYEGLLIAHEYRHDLQDSFKTLADNMARVSELALTTATSSYARLLRTQVPTQPCTPYTEAGSGSAESAESRDRRLEAAFICQLVHSRIVEPAERWYGTDVFAVAKAVRTLVEPLTGLSHGPEPGVARIEDLVSTRIFTSKARLMHDFGEKIVGLRQLLKNGPSDSTGRRKADPTPATKP
jgi:hypothetical protein